MRFLTIKINFYEKRNISLYSAPTKTCQHRKRHISRSVDARFIPVSFDALPTCIDAARYQHYSFVAQDARLERAVMTRLTFSHILTNLEVAEAATALSVVSRRCRFSGSSSAVCSSS